MNLMDVFLGCFVFGILWSLAAVLLGGFHFGHHVGASGHAAHVHLHPVHAGRSSAGSRCAPGTHGGWFQHFLSFHTLAIFLAWMGGCGYLMMRHTRFGLLLVLSVSTVVGLAGGAALAFILRFLHGREFAMHPADYDMVGVLGRISSPIRQGGTGEMIFTRDGARKLAYVRSEAGNAIERDQEVVVTSYQGGIAYVRTWDALTNGNEPGELSRRDRGLGAEDAPLTHG
jgi:membrane protein implicated in regulation of membrane protease activity